MDIQPFKLERYFAAYEFSAPHLLSSSDCDGLAMHDLLRNADPLALEAWDRLQLGYTESAGSPALRREIASLYAGVQQDDVLIAAPEEGIFLTMHALLERGDHVVCISPSYQSLHAIAESIGCEVAKWEPTEEGAWRFDPERLRAALRPETKLIALNFPHNPTGALLSQADFRAVMDMAREHGIRVFADEMYRYLELDPSDRLPSAVELDETALSLFGMSKTFGLAGLRIGWVVSKDRKVMKKIQTLKDYTTICSSAPSEVLALMGLRQRESIVARHIERIRRNLACLDQFFAEFSAIASWVRPKAGTICLARLLLKEPASQFCKRTVEAAGIMLLPSTVYDYGDRHVRVGFGRENLPQVLSHFSQYLRHHASR